MRLTLIFSFLVALLGAPTVAGAQSAVVSFESVASPGLHLSVDDGARLSIAAPHPGRAKADFWFVFGAPPSGSGITIEAVRHPGYFLSYAGGGELAFRKSDGSDAFFRTATFVMTEGHANLSGDRTRREMLLEAKGKPGWYVRVCDQRLQLADSSKLQIVENRMHCGNDPRSFWEGVTLRPGDGVTVGKDLGSKAPAPAPAVLTNRNVYIRSTGGSLYLHSNGGSNNGAAQTLHPCPKARNHPNCQWRFEASTTRSGAYYVRASDKPLYLHAHGGSKPGAKETLHPCPKDRDPSNCQWYVEPSTTRSGSIYLRSAGGGGYLHAFGGSESGAEHTLHPCPKGTDHSNCQWVVE